jgi:hypothetical protein
MNNDGGPASISMNSTLRAANKAAIIYGMIHNHDAARQNDPRHTRQSPRQFEAYAIGQKMMGVLLQDTRRESP